MSVTELLQHYDIVFSTVSNIQDAQVICFGEVHGTVSHKIDSRSLMDVLRCNNDILLLETDHKDRDQMPTDWIETGCWDKDHLSSRDADVLRKEFRYINLANDPCALDLMSLDDLNPDRPCALCCRLLCWGCLVTCCRPCVKCWAFPKAQRQAQAIIDGCIKRDESLRDSIEKASEYYSRVFLVAGQGHLQPSPYSKILDYQAVNASVQKTWDYLATKRAMVLVPKPRPVIVTDRQSMCC